MSNIQRRSHMRNLILLFSVSVLYLSSCSAGRTASRNYNNDDVYYSEREAASGSYGRIEPDNNQNPNSSNPGDYSSTTNPNTNNERFNDNNNQSDYNNSQSGNDQDGNTYVTNNYYNDDDYYDYAYSSRLRRFYHPYGWSYYDSYYTNMYWYDYDPFSYGVSVYLTYDWWRPRNVWTPGWSVSLGWGDPYYSGYGGYYSGYNNYWNGYNNGYMAGYYNGLYNGTFNPYYFNSNDSYSYYYGPRGGSGRGAIASNAPRGGRNLSELYGRQPQVDNPKTPRIATAIDGSGAIGRPKRDIGSPKSENASTPIKVAPSTGNGRTETSPVKTDGSVRGGVKEIKDAESTNPRIKTGRDLPGKSGVKNNDDKDGVINNNGVPGRNVNPGDYTPRTTEPVKSGNNNTPGTTEPIKSGNDYTPRNPTVNPRSNQDNGGNNPKQNTRPVQSTPRQHNQDPKQNNTPRQNPTPRSESQPSYQQDRNPQPAQQRSYEAPSRSNNNSSPSRSSSPSQSSGPRHR